MKKLPNLNLNSEKVYSLLKNMSINYGGEAIICRSNNPHTLYKIFMCDNNPQVISSNKEAKITRLFDLKLPNSTHPVSTISMDGNLIGYEMTYDQAFHPIATIEPFRIETIEALKKAKDILEYYATKDIVYGDVKNDNVLINPKTGEIKFCDMDNIKLGEYPIDIATPELAHFLSLGNEDQADSYMHNLLTLEMLNYFYTERYEDILAIIQTGNVPEGYQREANPIIKSMLRPETFTGEYIIQYVKKDI